MTSSVDSGLLARWQLAKAASTDPRLSRSNLAVLFVILDHINGGTGEAWPGKAAIAKAAGIHESTAKAGVRRLVALGYLLRESGGLGFSNRYRIGSAPSGCELATGIHSTPSRGLESKPPGGAKRRSKGVRVAAPNLLINQLREPAELNSLSASRFSEFWLAYPKKEGKPKAESAWRSKKLDQLADAILADLALSFGDGGRWKGTQMQFVPLPASYLNARRWEDVWAPTRAPGQVPREPRTDDQIAAENTEALLRIGGSHG